MAKILIKIQYWVMKEIQIKTKCYTTTYILEWLKFQKGDKTVIQGYVL